MLTEAASVAFPFVASALLLGLNRSPQPPRLKSRILSPAENTIVYRELLRCSVLIVLGILVWLFMMPAISWQAAFNSLTLVPSLAAIGVGLLGTTQILSLIFFSALRIPLEDSSPSNTRNHFYRTPLLKAYLGVMTAIAGTAEELVTRIPFYVLAMKGGVVPYAILICLHSFITESLQRQGSSVIPAMIGGCLIACIHLYLVVLCGTVWPVLVSRFSFEIVRASIWYKK